MTIQTGRGKPRGARAGLGTGDRGNRSTQRDSKDVPQFAPNFTVYVLPPDVVCLYSEDRKFFLHGALYCALASALGAGKSSEKLVRELEQVERRVAELCHRSGPFWLMESVPARERKGRGQRRR